MHRTDPTPTLRDAPPTTRRTLRSLAALVATGLLLVAGASATYAHDTLLSTDPADGSTVPVAPEAVTLTFSSPAMALGTRVVVLTPDGRDAAAGEPLLDGAAVTQPLSGELPPGRYTVQWRVTSADGHPVDGTFAFTAASGTGTPEPTPTPTPTPTQAPSPTSGAGQTAAPSPTPSALPTIDPGPRSGGPASFVVGALFVVVAAVAVAALLAARRRRP